MNPFNDQLTIEAAWRARAIRTPAGVCAPGERPGDRMRIPYEQWRDRPSAPPAPETLHRRILASSNGDNTLIQSPRGRIAVHEIFLWNPTATVDIELFDGPSAADFSLSLVQLASFAIQAGFTLGFATDPHFIIREGNPFILNLSLLTTVTGFLKYRII